ncbi:hypothetical protein [Cognaticolwellia mytili]|uniref:hypothetical protein n=1 Tax=Cognaticolwellia mytili TaxID=1888913 RepID=UPI000A1705AA|nr:hypothetical protein [Cognaticolwellia mytili]
MINNSLQRLSDLKTFPAQSVNEQPHTLTDELNHIAPEMVQELLSQFDEKRVEQLLHQQLASLTTSSNEPAVFDYQYSDKELALRTVISNQQEGLLNNENSDELMKRLNKSVKDIHGAYANTSDILASLGQLGHQQKSFLASSEQRVERALGFYMEDFNRKNNENDDNYRFELSVKTKEGDIINVRFNSSQGYDENTGKTVDGFGLSYEVKGDLSEAEHQALTEVLSGVGEMADDFFKVSKNSSSQYVPVGQSDFNVDFLAAFNHQQLSGFDVSFSTTENQQLDGNKNNLDLSYNIDQGLNQQALTFKSQAGINEIDFSLDMSTFGGKDVKQMQQYIATLDKNLEDSRHNSKGDDGTSAFGRKDDLKMQQGFAIFKGAFASMSSAAQRYSDIESLAAKQFTDGRAMVSELVDNMITKDPRYQGLGSGTDNILGSGISKLADFDAEFSFSKEPQGRALRPKVTVELAQATQQHKSGKLSGVTQSKTVATHFDYQLTRPDYYDKKESYNIGTAVEDRKLVGLDQKHQVDVSKEDYQLNPKTSQYELTMALNEKITNESNIRLVNDIWLEKTENSHETDKKDRIANEGGPEDFSRTNSYSHKKLITLIGDLDKLAENKHAKREYLVGSSHVNFFMDSNNK